MSEYNPDRWVILKITSPDETLYKVFGSWSGGYLDGDSWRMNSGITEVMDDEEKYVFVGHSGSRYNCWKTAYGASGLSYSIIQGMIERAEDKDYDVEILDNALVVERYTLDT